MNWHEPAWAPEDGPAWAPEDGFVPSEYIYDSADVHLGTVNPDTGEVGSCYTPTHRLRTACQASWGLRPRRTLLPRLVTCSACLETLQAQAPATPPPTFETPVARLWRALFLVPDLASQVR